MMRFDACRVCKPPKRHPGCHGKCEAYLTAKEYNDAIRGALHKKQANDTMIREIRDDAVRKARHGNGAMKRGKYG